MVIIKGIDIDDIDSVEMFKNIIKKLTMGDVYYFHFQREDSFFLTDDEIKKYRKEVPEYLKSNGKYQIKYKIDDERFDSIGFLEINEDTYGQVSVLWKYFEGMTFFNPSKLLNWEEYEEIYNKIKPEEYGIGIIQNGYAESVFIKGHDGDNLIFVYKTDPYSKMLDDVLKYI